MGTITITNKHQYISNHEVSLDLPSFASERANNENLEDTSNLEEGDWKRIADIAAGIPRAQIRDVEENRIKAKCADRLTIRVRSRESILRVRLPLRMQ